MNEPILGRSEQIIKFLPKIGDKIQEDLKMS